MRMQERILYSKFSVKFTHDRGALKPHECPQRFTTHATYIRKAR